MKLEVRNLDVSYEQLNVLKNVNIIVEQGVFFTVLGDSGSGKSTILKAVSGLIPLNAGEIYLNETDISAIPTERRDIAFVFQKPLLFPHLNVRQNLSFQLEILKWSKEAIGERIKELAELLQIEELLGRYPHELSGGQQQRVSIGRAIAAKPKIILMDEPFSSLDPKLRKEMGKWLKSLQRSLNLTILFVTHDVNEALSLSDQLAYLEEGVIKQQDEPTKVYNFPETKTIAEFLGPCNWIEEGGIFGVDIPYGFQMLKRPHQLTLKFGGPYEVVDIEEVGRSCFVTVSGKKNKMIVEEDQLMLKVGDKVSVSKRPFNDHFVKRHFV